MVANAPRFVRSRHEMRSKRRHESGRWPFRAADPSSARDAACRPGRGRAGARTPVTGKGATRPGTLAALAAAGVVLGAVATSSNPVFVRLSDVPETASAFHRMAWALPAFAMWGLVAGLGALRAGAGEGSRAPVVAQARRPRRPTRSIGIPTERRDLLLLVLCGAFFAGDSRRSSRRGEPDDGRERNPVSQRTADLRLDRRMAPVRGAHWPSVRRRRRACVVRRRGADVDEPRFRRRARARRSPRRGRGSLLRGIHSRGEPASDGLLEPRDQRRDLPRRRSAAARRRARRRPADHATDRERLVPDDRPRGPGARMRAGLDSCGDSRTCPPHSPRCRCSSRRSPPPSSHGFCWRSRSVRSRSPAWRWCLSECTSRGGCTAPSTPRSDDRSGGPGGPPVHSASLARRTRPAPCT